MAQIKSSKSRYQEGDQVELSVSYGSGEVIFGAEPHLVLRPRGSNAASLDDFNGPIATSSGVRIGSSGSTYTFGIRDDKNYEGVERAYFTVYGVYDPKPGFFSRIATDYYWGQGYLNLEKGLKVYEKPLADISVEITDKLQALEVNIPYKQISLMEGKSESVMVSLRGYGPDDKVTAYLEYLGPTSNNLDVSLDISGLSYASPRVSENKLRVNINATKDGIFEASEKFNLVIQASRRGATPVVTKRQFEITDDNQGMTIPVKSNTAQIGMASDGRYYESKKNPIVTNIEFALTEDVLTKIKPENYELTMLKGGSSDFINQRISKTTKGLIVELLPRVDREFERLEEFEVGIRDKITGKLVWRNSFVVMDSGFNLKEFPIQANLVDTSSAREVLARINSKLSQNNPFMPMVVTSAYRSPAEQARAMLENYLYVGNTVADGLNKLSKQYSRGAGPEVVRLWSQELRSGTAFDFSYIPLAKARSEEVKQKLIKIATPLLASYSAHTKGSAIDLNLDATPGLGLILSSLVGDGIKMVGAPVKYAFGNIESWPYEQAYHVEF